jgi:hypothetical protein
MDRIGPEASRLVTFKFFIFIFFHRFFKNTRVISNFAKLAKTSYHTAYAILHGGSYQFIFKKIVTFLYELSRWKKFELQSYISRRKLQFSYKLYLHPSSYKRRTTRRLEHCSASNRRMLLRLDPNAMQYGGSSIVLQDSNPIIYFWENWNKII